MVAMTPDPTSSVCLCSLSSALHQCSRSLPLGLSKRRVLSPCPEESCSSCPIPRSPFSCSTGFSPQNSKARKGKGVLLLCLSLLFSLNPRRMDRGRCWRAFKLVCDQGGLPPQSHCPSTLGVWKRPAQHQPRFANSAMCLLTFFPPFLKASSSSWADGWLWLAGSGKAAGGDQAPLSPGDALSCSWKSAAPDCSWSPSLPHLPALPWGQLSVHEHMGKQSLDLAPPPLPGHSPHSEILARVQV